MGLEREDGFSFYVLRVGTYEKLKSGDFMVAVTYTDQDKLHVKYMGSVVELADGLFAKAMIDRLCLEEEENKEAVFILFSKHDWENNRDMLGPWGEETDDDDD